MSILALKEWSVRAVTGTARTARLMIGVPDYDGRSVGNEYRSYQRAAADFGLSDQQTDRKACQRVKVIDRCDEAHDDCAPPRWTLRHEIVRSHDIGGIIGLLRSAATRKTGACLYEVRKWRLRRVRLYRRGAAIPLSDR